MTSKRANWLFLTIILVHFGVVVFLILGGEFIPDSIVLNFLLSQGILMVPTLVFLLVFERREAGFAPPVSGALQAGVPGMPQMPVYGARQRFEAAAFHKVKISTLLMILLCTFLIMPLVTVLNTLSMFFADNAVAAMEGDIISTPFPVMLFMIGIFGPFCEEFVFRGVIFRSYRRGGKNKDNGSYLDSHSNGVSAILLSSLLFGLMHMNFNQALYAFAIGIFLSLLVEAAGSLWASVFCHVFFNSCQVILMYVSGNILESVYGQAANEAAEQLSTQELLAALSVYLVIAAVTTPIAACVISWIAKNEGRQEAFRELFRRRPEGQKAPRPMPMNQPQPPAQRMQQPMPMNRPQPPMQWNSQMPPMQMNQQPPHADYLLSVPLIIGVVLCLGYMSLELFLVI